MAAPLLLKVGLRNYKSIASCDVDLGLLTYLVGPNGAGKSNFLDSLRFVSEALSTTLDHAMQVRGGISEVRRRSSGHPNDFSIELWFGLSEGVGIYQFRIGMAKKGQYVIKREECILHSKDTETTSHFAVEGGQLVGSSQDQMPAASPDRLYLVAASGIPSFRPVFDALSGMDVLSINPESIRQLQNPDSSTTLKRSGENLASIVERMKPKELRQVESFLQKIVPGLDGICEKSLGNRKTIEFTEKSPDGKKSWRFDAHSMSDGTLRALGILVGIFQAGGKPDVAMSVLGIEEPETALHPAAAGVLRDALRSGSRNRQLIVSSHSPDLLDDPALDPDSVYTVIHESGETRIGRMDSAAREMLRKKLYTLGELLRIGQVGFEPLPAAPPKG